MAQKADLQRLQGAASEITAEAAIRHKTADIEAEAAVVQERGAAEGFLPRQRLGARELLNVMCAELAPCSVNTAK